MNILMNECRDAVALILSNIGTVRERLSHRLVCRGLKDISDNTSVGKSLIEYKPFIRPLFVRFVSFASQCKAEDSFIKQNQAIWRALACSGYFTSESASRLRLVGDFKNVSPEDKGWLIAAICFMQPTNERNIIFGPKNEDLTPREIAQKVKEERASGLIKDIPWADKTMDDVDQYILVVKQNRENCDIMREFIDRYQIFTVEEITDPSIWGKISFSFVTSVIIFLLAYLSQSNEIYFVGWVDLLYLFYIISKPSVRVTNYYD